MNGWPKRDLERRIALVVPHFLSAPFIVAKTDTLLSLPERSTRQFVGLAPLRMLPVPMDLPVYELVMIWHPLRENDPAHRWLREQILAVCQTILDEPSNDLVTAQAVRQPEL